MCTMLDTHKHTKEEVPPGYAPGFFTELYGVSESRNYLGASPRDFSQKRGYYKLCATRVSDLGDRPFSNTKGYRVKNDYRDLTVTLQH